MRIEKRVRPALVFGMMLMALLMPFTVGAGRNDVAVYDRGGFYMEYPEDWVLEAFEEEDMLMIANSRSALNIRRGGIQADELQIGVFRSALSLGIPDLEIEAGDDVEEKLLYMFPALEDIETVELDHSDGAYGFMYDNEGLDFVFLLLVFPNGDSTVLIALSAPGALEDWMEDILEIANSVTKAGVDVVLSEEYAENNFTFQYPEGWYVELEETRDGDLILIGSSEDAVESDDIEDGELFATLIPSLQAIYGELGSDDPVVVVNVMIEEFAEPVIEELVLGGNHAAYAIYEDESTDTENMVLVLVHPDGTMSLLLASTTPGDMDEYMGALLAMAATFRFEGSAVPFGGLRRNSDGDVPLLLDLIENFTAGAGQ